MFLADFLTLDTKGLQLGVEKGRTNVIESYHQIVESFMFEKLAEQVFGITFVRFGIVGLATNISAYIAYLILTVLSINPITAMSIIFAIALIVGFIAHSKYTFVQDRNTPQFLLKYLFVYAIVYAVNFLLLLLFTEFLEFPHQVIQAIAILICGLTLYKLQKNFVFN